MRVDALPLQDSSFIPHCFLCFSGVLCCFLGILENDCVYSAQLETDMKQNDLGEKQRTISEYEFVRCCAAHVTEITDRYCCECAHEQSLHQEILGILLYVGGIKHERGADDQRCESHDESENYSELEVFIDFRIVLRHNL